MDNERTLLFSVKLQSFFFCVQFVTWSEINFNECDGVSASFSLFTILDEARLFFEEKLPRALLLLPFRKRGRVSCLSRVAIWEGKRVLAPEASSCINAKSRREKRRPVYSTPLCRAKYKTTLLLNLTLIPVCTLFTLYTRLQIPQECHAMLSCSSAISLLIQRLQRVLATEISKNSLYNEHV